VTARDGAFLSADEVWLDGWRGPSLLRVEGTTLEWVSPLAASGESIRFHLQGTVLGGFTDSHVHLGLIDPSGLVAAGIAHVVDLGGDPSELATLREQGQADATAVGVEFAGTFLTPPGGYPSDRSWAPAASYAEVATPEESESAIARLTGLGASRIKIAVNSVAGPVWSDSMLATVVAQAHAAGLPAVAHVEGAGETERALRAGVDCLAHTPWTERLDDDVIAHLAARVSICSTLDIHGYGDHDAGFAVASDNLSRFAARGGRVLYGTDLGNGPLPVGLNEREIAALAAAGLDLDALVSSLVPRTARFRQRISWIPSARPTDPADAVPWLSSSKVLPVSTLEETFA
jgi:hypothetical protein